MAAKPNIKTLGNENPSQKYGYIIVGHGDWFGSDKRYAVSTGYGIFNQTDQDIYASNAILGNIKIPSQYNKYNGYQPEGVILEVSVYIDSTSYGDCCKHIPANTSLDIAIKEIVIHEIQRQKNVNEYSEIISADIKFRLPLNNVAVSKGENGYYSEILGLFITDKHKDLALYLAEVPEALNEKINNGTAAYTEYQMAYIIDNDNEIGNVWTMNNGKPVMLKRSKQNGQASGLYIFNKETAATQLGYKYLSVAEVNDKDTLSKEGFALSEESLAEKNHTKEYKTLKETERSYNELKEEFKSLKKLCDIINAEKETLETDIDNIINSRVKQITDAHEKAIKELNVANDKMIKELTHSHNREVKDLQREIQRTKRLLIDEQSDETKRRKVMSEQLTIGSSLIGCVVTIGNFIIAMTKFFSSGKQTR